MATSYYPQQDQPTQNKPSNGSFDINSQITNALHQGMSPQDITTYLSNKGYGQAAKDYFGIKDPEEKKGIFARIGEDLGKRTQDAASALANKDNKLTGAETILRTTGALAGGINDIIGEGISSGIDALPDNVKKVGSDILNSPVGQAGLNLIKKGTDIYNNFSENHPRAAKDIESVANIASLLPTGKVAKVGSEVAEQGLKTAGRTALKVGEEAVDLGKNVATKASDVVTPLEKGVQNVLKGGQEISGSSKIPKLTEIQNKFNKYTTQAQRAIEDYSQATPLELAGKQAENSLKILNNKLQSIGAEKAVITNSLADIDTGEIVNNAIKKLKDSIQDRTGVKISEKINKSTVSDFLDVRGNPLFSLNNEEPTKKIILRDAANRTSVISDPSDIKLIKNIYEKFSSVAKSPNFKKVDDLVDFVQGELYKRSTVGAIPINDKVEGVLKNIIEELNNNLKDIGGDAYKLKNSQYSKLLEIRNILNKGLGVDANKGAALMKQLFSPSGTMARKLFTRIKDLTGIDLVQEATLAKFAMENIGDVRQASLLEQVLKGGAPTSKSGVIRYAADKILNKLQDPIGKANRVIETELKKASK